MTWPDRTRRGANALEFGLVLPVLVLMIVGVVDYGWFFARQSSVMAAMTGAVRAGSMLQPGESEEIGCSPCTAAVEAHLEASLIELGFEPRDVTSTVTMVPLADTCALNLVASVPHSPLLGLYKVPEAFTFNVVANAEFVKACTGVSANE